MVEDGRLTHHIACDVTSGRPTLVAPLRVSYRCLRVSQGIHLVAEQSWNQCVTSVMLGSRLQLFLFEKLANTNYSFFRTVYLWLCGHKLSVSISDVIKLLIDVRI